MKLKFTRKTWYFFLLAAAAVSMLGGFAVLGGMDFSSDANANFEGLLAVNRGICMPQMAEKTSPDTPPNCAVLP